MSLSRTVSVFGLFVVGACSNDDSAKPGAPSIVVPDEPVAGITSEGCGSVRLTSYTASNRGWCEFDRTLAVLPNFVREGLTLAIAEPYNGSSYQGEPGEACGECWEIDTLYGTRTVMVHDLCPVEGNPLCAGGHFHFDLSEESGVALDAGKLDEGRARRVACSVTGNVSVEINDRNEWGYLRVAFVNHRIPIRAAEYRPTTGDVWRPLQRSGGAWHVLEDNQTFAQGGPGGVFRLTSTQGETVEGNSVLGYDVAIHGVFDLGVQFTESHSSGTQACEFAPPAVVYDDAWGGIDQVRWQINPWGSASASETSSGCVDNGASCVVVSNLGQYSGFHLYYRQNFPVSTFSRAELRLRRESGEGQLVVAPSRDGERCSEQTVLVTQVWSTVSIALGGACQNLSEINGLTVDNPGQPLTLLLDDVRFVP